MIEDPNRWQIPWMREYKQYIVEPPIDAVFESDDWMELSFDTIREAMDWIDKTMRQQPAVDSPVDNVPAAPVATPILIEETSVPAYVPREVVDDVVEPPREYSRGEDVPRRPSLNPQGATSDSQQDRLSDYAQRVGLA